MCERSDRNRPPDFSAVARRQPPSGRRGFPTRSAAGVFMMAAPPGLFSAGALAATTVLHRVDDGGSVFRGL